MNDKNVIFCAVDLKIIKKWCIETLEMSYE